MSIPTVTVASYIFHGVSVEISGDDAQVAGALASRLAPFCRPLQNGTDIGVTITSGDPASLERPPGHGRPVYDPLDGEVLYFEASDLLFIRYAQEARLIAAPGRGTIAMAVRTGPAATWAASHALFTLAFIECLKRRARFSLHAAGLAVGGRAILVAGTSGSGKSTTAVALLRAGFGFLSDDMVFLLPGGDGLTVGGFPDEIDVTSETIRLFPELAGLTGAAANPVNGKRSFRPEEIYDVALARPCAPAALVLAGTRVPGPSRLEAVGADEALLELAPNVLLTDAAAAQAHLEALAELTRACPCYRLQAGPRMEELPGLFAPLV